MTDKPLASVEACFGDLASEIFAVETGLSSDPPMNWRMPELDRMTIISNSDAHSPEKLGREGNLFDTELSYPALHAAIRTGNQLSSQRIVQFQPWNLRPELFAEIRGPLDRLLRDLAEDPAAAALQEGATCGDADHPRRGRGGNPPRPHRSSSVQPSWHRRAAGR